VHVDVDAATAIARAAQRAAAGTDASDADAEVAAARHAAFVAPGSGEGLATTRIDGALAAEALTPSVLAALLDDATPPRGP
jgi:hypothetical protein